AWNVQSLQAGGELWLEWGAAGLERAAARLHARELTIAYAERPPLSLSDLAGKLFFNAVADGYQLQLDGIAFSLGELRWDETRLDIQHRDGGDGGQWELSSPRIDIGPLATLVSAWVPLPEKAQEVLQALLPYGMLRNLQAKWQPSAPLYQRLELGANLADVGIQSWQGVPALDKVSGQISGGLGA